MQWNGQHAKVNSSHKNTAIRGYGGVHRAGIKRLAQGAVWIHCQGQADQVVIQIPDLDDDARIQRNPLGKNKLSAIIQSGDVDQVAGCAIQAGVYLPELDNGYQAVYPQTK